jgi:hypothetical protein
MRDEFFVGSGLTSTFHSRTGSSRTEAGRRGGGADREAWISRLITQGRSLELGASPSAE